jgi:hypothetical protein
MRPYHHRPLQIHFNGRPPSSGELMIQCAFEPLQSFGGTDVPGAVARGSASPTIRWHPSNGRLTVENEIPLQSISRTVDDGDISITVDGCNTTTVAYCDNRGEVEEMLSMHFSLLPLTLSTEFSEPVTLSSIRGSWENVEFDLRYETFISDFETTDEARQEQRFEEAWNHVGGLLEPSNLRLVRALEYFHTASRLGRVGNTPWEFAAEIILNLCKSLECLFAAGSRDEVRSGLTHFGISDDEIERVFMPAVALRSALDVAHVSLASFGADDLKVLHHYCASMETPFRNLFRQVLERCAAGTFRPKPYADPTPGAAAHKLLQRLGQHFAPFPGDGGNQFKGK